LTSQTHTDIRVDRLTIPETPRYTFDVARDVEQADEDVKAYMTGKREGDTDEIARAQVHASAKSNLQVPKASWSDFCQHYSKWKNLSILIGTAGSWFCLDVAFYGLSLNNGTILKVIGYSSKDANNMYEFLYNTAVGNIIIVLAGAVPGYWVSVATIDTLGRKTIQLGGFIILTILFIVSSVVVEVLQR
jgi:MFS transporter, PHS family, inorganic phosphate transporter